jgi:FtsP/CotA-like multicopper oxidase with cupredoxin domain
LAGATIENPPELRSTNGTLKVTLHVKYQQTMLGEGPPRYCYVTDEGVESPTLRVRPGDKLIIHLHNDLPAWSGAGGPASPSHATHHDDCAGMNMDPSFTNLHFHGMSIPPVCHQDDVIRTAIPTGDEFDYRVMIPRDAAPGLYWYHPHPHGFSERQVQGGASGALIVEGIESAVPSVKSLYQRVLVLRDQQRVELGPPRTTIPAWDISANFVPIIYPNNQPAQLEVAPDRKELWRVLNAAADVIFNLQVVVNGTAQPVQVVALDGVPISQARKLPPQDKIFLPPGSRAEFILTTPKVGEHAQLVTRAWDTGPQGDNDTERTIAEIVPSEQLNNELQNAGRGSGATSNYAKDIPDTAIRRRLYFSQISGNAQDADLFVLYFITVVGQTPKTYEMGSPPNIVIHQGDVEDWIVENRSGEDHVFHIHQIHFKVMEVDGKPVDDPTMRDTIDVPYWSGKGPYPSVKLRMDFRDPSIEGTFLYHCHILKHEDMGMMGSIQVLPKGTATATSIRLASGNKPQAGDPAHFVANVVPAHAPGYIQFAVDGLDIGHPVPLANGQAVLDTSFVDQGRHSVTATYSGDATFDESAGKVALTVR